MVMLTHRGDGRGARAAAFEHLGPLQYASLQNRKSDCDSLSKMHVMYFLAHPYPIKPPAFGGPSLAGLTAEASPAPRPSPVTLYPVEPPECCVPAHRVTCLHLDGSSAAPLALLVMWVVVAEVQSRTSRKDRRSSCTFPCHWRCRRRPHHWCSTSTKSR